MIRPEVLIGYSPKVDTPCGTLYLTLNELDGKLFEVRATMGKCGSCYGIMLQTITLFISVMLQEGISKQRICDILFKQFGGSCGQTIWHNGEKYSSCVDFMVQKIIEDMASRGEVVPHEENQETKEENNLQTVT